MRVATTPKNRSVRSEQIILFRVSGQLFAISSASVQEVRGVDSLSGSSTEIPQSPFRKVRHIAHRGEQSLYVVSAALHFGLAPAPPALVFLLRKTRTALLIDAIDKMTSMTWLQALPQPFHHEERHWYRGLTVIDQNVIPVVSPEGFLLPAELSLLDATVSSGETESGEPAPESGFLE